MINLYIINKNTGEFLYQDMGNPQNIINDLTDDKDFTTLPPPDNTKVWYWLDGQWTAKE